MSRTPGTLGAVRTALALVVAAGAVTAGTASPAVADAAEALAWLRGQAASPAERGA